MDRKEILQTLDKYDLDKNQCIILSGASLAVQEIIEGTNDIDIATTNEFYNSLPVIPAFFKTSSYFILTS